MSETFEWNSKYNLNQFNEPHHNNLFTFITPTQKRNKQIKQTNKNTLKLINFMWMSNCIQYFCGFFFIKNFVTVNCCFAFVYVFLLNYLLVLHT